MTKQGFYNCTDKQISKEKARYGNAFWGIMEI